MNKNIPLNIFIIHSLIRKMTEVISFLDLPDDILVELIKLDHIFAEVNHDMHSLYLSNKDYLDHYNIEIKVFNRLFKILINKPQSISFTYLELIGVKLAIDNLKNLRRLTVIKFPVNIPSLYPGNYNRCSEEPRLSISNIASEKIKQSVNWGTFISYTFIMKGSLRREVHTYRNEKKFKKEVIDGIIKYIRAVYSDIKFLVVNGVDLISP